MMAERTADTKIKEGGVQEDGLKTRFPLLFLPAASSL